MKHLRRYMRLGGRLGVRVFLPLLALALPAACSFEIDYDRYAVVYGVSQYDNNLPINFRPNLQYPDDDAIAVVNLLSEQGFYVYSRIRNEEIDQEPTKANIWFDFELIRNELDEDDLFLFYYSGHGGQLHNSSGQTIEALFLSESLIPDGSDYVVDSSKILTDADLRDLLRTLPSRKKVVIIDACNSGGFIGNSLEKDRFPVDYSGTKESWFGTLGNALSLYANFTEQTSDIPPSLALVLSAAGEQDWSWEGGLVPHGIFTYFLLESVKYGDRNRDGWITATEAYSYALRGIEKHWNPYPDYRIATQSEWVYAPRVSGGPIDYVLFKAR